MQEEKGLKIPLSAEELKERRRKKEEQLFLDLLVRVSNLEQKLVSLERQLYHSVKRVSSKRKKAEERQKTTKAKRKKGRFLVN